MTGIVARRDVAMSADLKAAPLLIYQYGDLHFLACAIGVFPALQ
jgi:hypothetical protein